MRKIEIDARDMVPPEPLERALAALDLMGSKGELTLMLNQRPYPLFQILSSNGYAWQEEDCPDGGFRYRVFHRSQVAA